VQQTTKVKFFATRDTVGVGICDRTSV